MIPLCPQFLIWQCQQIILKQRAPKIAIVPDKISERVEKLGSSDQIKGRSKAIFGTGDAMKILTVTANQGFVRAAQSQGIRLAVIIHESSCLTESKMSTATEITIENWNA